MAGGKLSPRQKMINLMYLVFIAMLALNMSKEVLTAFGLMNEKFEGVNKFSEEYNGSLYGQLESKAGENKAQFGAPFEKAQQIKPIVKEFNDFVQGLKNDITKDIEKDASGKLPYESMDKGDKIDEAWFTGDGYSKKGKDIIAAFDKFKSGIAGVIGKDVKYQPILKDVNAKFSTADVKDHEGVTKLFLDYHFKGFPAVASLTKLSAIQSDIKKTEQDIYNALIGNTTAQAASMSNYKAIVVFEKSVVFQGEAVKGKVVLGRYDESTVPNSFNVNGASSKIENGQAVFNATAGGVGEKEISGKFTFIEDGKSIPVEFKEKYVVVPRPNSANISADKMNVVYRGLPNPMTISFAGISDDKVNASAPGLSKAGKPGAYNLNPGSGTEVVVNVTGKLPDGKTVADKKAFRIKNIPAPVGAIGGEMGSTKGSKSRLEVSQISAKLPDFLYDLNFQVTQFTFKVSGQAAVIVNGDRVNGQCKMAMAKAGRGDVVVISDIKTKIVGVSANIMTGKTAPVTYEIQ